MKTTKKLNSPHEASACVYLNGPATFLRKHPICLALLAVLAVPLTNTFAGDVVIPGAGNTAPGFNSVIVSGQSNTASGAYSFIGGGFTQTTAGSRSGILAGDKNSTSGNYSFIGAGVANISSGEKSGVMAGQSNESPGIMSGVSCGYLNKSQGNYSFVGGGNRNTASGQWSMVGTGGSNTASGDQSFVGGGMSNLASGVQSFVGSGNNNTASSNDSFVGGGDTNTASGGDAFIGAGDTNTASGEESFIGAGVNNTVSGADSFIGGGQNSTLAATNSFILGNDINYSGADAGVIYLSDNSRAGTALAQDLDSDKMYCRFNNGLDFFASSTGTDADFAIQSDGKVSLGQATNPSLRGALNVRPTEAGNVQGVVVIDRIAEDGILIRFRRDGTTQGTIDVAAGVVSYNAFTGSHYATTKGSIARGMLVSLNGENGRLEHNPESEVIYGVAPTTRENDPAVMGSYLARQSPEAAQPDDMMSPHLVAAVGNGDMWVIDTGEDVAAGQYLVSTSVAGHAMVDPESFKKSHIVGRVAESIDWKSVTETVIGADGREYKHALVSVFYENFVIDRTNSRAKEAEVTKLREENAAIAEKLALLEARDTELRTQNEAIAKKLAAVEARDTAREARLIRLEKALGSDAGTNLAASIAIGTSN